MANYVILEYSNNFDAADFNLAANESKMATKEGTKTLINYGFDNESGKQMLVYCKFLETMKVQQKKLEELPCF